MAKEALAKEDNEEGNAAVEEEAPFARVVESSADTEDQRRLSLRYYLVPTEWRFGGGIEFEGKNADDAGVVVEAKRDRLVLWKSAETALRGLPVQRAESVRPPARVDNRSRRPTRDDAGCRATGLPIHPDG